MPQAPQEVRSSARMNVTDEISATAARKGGSRGKDRMLSSSLSMREPPAAPASISIMFGSPLALIDSSRQTQEAAADEIAVEELYALPLRDHLAGLQHIGVARNRKGDPRILLDEEDRRALLAINALDDLEDALEHHGRQAE